MDNIEQEIARCCGTVADKERMQQLVKELTDQLKDVTRQCGVMAQSLREAISVLSSINHGREHKVHIEGDEPAFWQRGEWVDWAKSEVLPKLQAALAGKLPDHFANVRNMVELDAYDAGHLNDYGGGNVGWWHDYIRSELDRAHDFYQSQFGDGNHTEQPLAMARVRKTGGSYQHTGTVVSEFRTLAGEQRIALEFDAPVAGMLHIYRPDQVEPLEGGV